MSMLIFVLITMFCSSLTQFLNSKIKQVWSILLENVWAQFGVVAVKRG